MVCLNEVKCDCSLIKQKRKVGHSSAIDPLHSKEIEVEVGLIMTAANNFTVVCTLLVFL